MDIEGAEVSALLASEDLLQNNNVRCAICTYHKKDEIFHIDKDIFSALDFRKGVIYAKKEM